MWILAPEDGVDLDDLFLPFESFEVVRHRHEVRLGRKLVRGMAPISILENAELAGLDELL